MRPTFLLCLCLTLWMPAASHADGPIRWTSIASPVIFRGDATTAYRDPAAVFHDGWFHLYFTLVKIEPDKRPFLCVARSKSRDRRTCTQPTTFTPRDTSLNYSSPGNVVRHGDQWVLCVQTYPRPN